MRQLVWAWLAALAMVGAAIAASFRFVPEKRPMFADAPVAIIGSSLMLGAFSPRGGGPSSVLGDGRSHQRIGIRHVEEWQMIDLADAAIDQGAQVILMEGYPFIRDFAKASDEHVCDARQVGLRSNLKQAQLAISDALHITLGLHGLSEQGDDEPKSLLDHQKIYREVVARFYPLTFHQPYCAARLAGIVSKARHRGVVIILLAPPHSIAAEAFVGRQMAEQDMRMRQLANNLELPLFMPRGPWSNNEFADQAHMNIKGRVHFMAAFKAWWPRRS